MLGAGDQDRRSALAWLLDDRAPELLPTPWLSDRRFEDFVERLLKAQPLLGPQVRHVAEVARWGVPGDKQDGIDLVGRYTDDVAAAWQCKHLRTLTAAQVRKAVGELTFEGVAEVYLVYADVAKVAARNEIQKHEGWRLWDRRDLSAMLRALPVQTQRDVIEEFWGPEVRRHFVESPHDTFVSLETFTRARLNPESVLNDLGALSGRTTELDAIREALDRDSDGYRSVIVVVGPGGRGKSRLLTDSLREVHDQQPHIAISCLAPGHVFSASAMAELRVGPSIVVIDDAHQAPEGLGALLAFARSRNDVQVVLASRPSGLRGISEQIIQAGFAPSEHLTLPVGELTKVEAERLVKELTDDVDLSFGLRQYLAGQAEHSPHVAVITTNLIKRGELTASLAVDAGLRQTVLNRYREVLAPDVDGFAGSTTRKVLATYAAIGPVAVEDRELMRRIADFCGVSIIDLARIVRSLRDHGVLVPQGVSLRVVPDIVADSVLEEQAAYDDHDTGFASDLWGAFGSGEHGHQLANTLGELDWRLARRGGPTLMDTIWAQINDRMLAYPYGRLYDELGQFDRLAATKPRALIGLLEEIRVRLDEEDRINAPVPDDGRAWRRRYGLAPIGRAEVRSKMPELYARAAANDPDLLETALDAIWAIRNQDSRPPHSNPDHAQRMVEDHLGNLVNLPDSSFPERIVARVERWLTEPDQADGVATPLFALKPLLAKEKVETVQSAPMTISMQAHGINPAATRNVRDRIRALLRRQALADDLRRAGEAVDLLEEALRQPHGYFGHSVGMEVVLAWEDDDLATIATLTDIGTRTGTPALRRLVRKVLAWPAEHAASTRFMHAALTTLATLDDLAGLHDDIADDLLGHRVFTLPRVRLCDVPSLENLEATQAVERERCAKMTDEERQTQGTESARARVECRRAQHDAADVAIADRLVKLGASAEIWVKLDRVARDVANLQPSSHVSLWGLWRQLSEKAPGLVFELVRRISDAEPGPLDSELPQLINLALQHQPEEAMRWLQDAVSQGRHAVRMSIAHSFDSTSWDHTGLLAQVWTTGSDDADRSIANAFLGAAGAYLRAAPVDAADTLLAKEINPHAATSAIENAAEYDGSTYGFSLTRDAAKAVLRLVGRAGYRSYGVQTTLAGIASRHPDLVLEHLAAHDDSDGIRLPEDIHDLGAAFEERADDLVDWIMESTGEADEDRQRRLGRVLATATNDRLTERQGDTFASRIPNLDGHALKAFCRVLSYLDTWPLRSPRLTHELAGRARQLGCWPDVRDGVLRQMHPSSWGGWNGESPELDSALERARHAAAQSVDSELRGMYGKGAQSIQATIDEDRRRHEADTQTGWDEGPAEAPQVTAVDNFDEDCDEEDRDEQDRDEETAASQTEESGEERAD
ncbi:restriction endonuclease [Nocardioides aromaticivorans]|uniref:restriction endonuclease n=1 Tax=Nocardioides aromaticivorans TaxID=200618 RepID=UPI001A8F6BA6|nr:restriction endonuclease [Nocardioides aromaticivorans]